MFHKLHMYTMATTMYNFSRYKGHIVFTGDSHVRAVFGYIQSIRQVPKEKIIAKQMAESHNVVKSGMCHSSGCNTFSDIIIPTSLL